MSFGFGFGFGNGQKQLVNWALIAGERMNGNGKGDVRVLGFAFELCAFLNLCTACLLVCIASYHIISYHMPNAWHGA